MNLTVAAITLRQLLSRRRVILLLLLGAVMFVVALVLRLSLDDVYLELYTAQVLSLVGVATLMPPVPNRSDCHAAPATHARRPEPPIHASSPKPVR